MLKTLWQTALTDVADNDVEGVGRIRVLSTGDIYRWVSNEDASNSFAAGDVVFHKLSNKATMFQTILLCATANLAGMAGVCMAALVANTGTKPKIYGWIQIYGVNTGILVEGTTDIAAGDHLIGVNAQKYVVQGSAAGTAPKYSRGIVALEAFITNSTGSKAGLIQCLQ